MHRQVGWTGLVERFKNEAPRYAQLLPELPRLVHQALQHHRDSDPAVLALLAEQRRTNRLLQALAYGIVGFVAGALAMQLLGRGAG
jgi:ubiquinone biosynthesis protein